MVMTSIVSKEFIYHRFADDLGLANRTKSTKCYAQNVSKDNEILQVEVDALSSEWTLYLSVAGEWLFVNNLFSNTVAYIVT